MGLESCRVWARIAVRRAMKCQLMATPLFTLAYSWRGVGPPGSFSLGFPLCLPLGFRLAPFIISGNYKLIRPHWSSMPRPWIYNSLSPCFCKRR